MMTLQETGASWKIHVFVNLPHPKYAIFIYGLLYSFKSSKQLKNDIIL